MAQGDAVTKKVKVVVRDGEKVIFEKTFDQFPITFGRDAGSNVALDSAFVSRSHCIIAEQEQNFILLSFGKGGVQVGGKTVEKYTIEKGLAFQIKDLRITIDVLDGAKQASAQETVNALLQKSYPRQPFAAPPPQQQQPPPVPSTAMYPPPPKAVPQQAVPTHFATDFAKAMNGSIPKQDTSLPITLSGQFPNPDHEPDMERFEASGAATVVSTPESRHAHHDRVPMLNVDFDRDIIDLHPAVATSPALKLELVVTWHDVIYDVREFSHGEDISVGPFGWFTVPVPVLSKPFRLAKVEGHKTVCFTPKETKLSFARGNKPISEADVNRLQMVKPHKDKNKFLLEKTDVAHLDFGSGMRLHLRYIPAPSPLAEKKLFEPEATFRRSLTSSFFLHLFLVISVMIMAPAAKDGPKLKNVPQRYARLIVKPKPTPAPTPPPPPEKKEVVKKEPPKPKEVVVHKQKPVKPPKVLAKKNKYPMEVKNPVAKLAPPVKVENLGALGALGAVMKNTPQNQVVTNININPNAGGMQKSVNTGGIVGALPSANGKLAAAGGPRVKTKGFGYGTGTGYGIQGLKGEAGTRGIAGVFVGEPKLAKLTKEEGLTRAQVMAVVQKYLGEIQHCYEKNLLSDPGLSGRMEFEWDISGSGQVTEVRVKRSTVNNGDGLGECVKDIFSAMKFPTAKNGLITTPSIGFPFGRL